MAAAGTGEMVSVLVALTPSALALMLTDSAAPLRMVPAVTKPVADTVAMAWLEEDQVIIRSVSSTPFLLSAAAVSCTVLPLASVVLGAVIRIDPIGVGSVGLEQAIAMRPQN